MSAENGKPVSGDDIVHSISQSNRYILGVPEIPPWRSQITGDAYYGIRTLIQNAVFHEN